MIAAALLSHRRHHAADRRESIPQVAGDLRGRTPHHLLNPLFGLRHKPGTGCRMQLVPVGAFQLPAFGLGEIIGMQRIAQGSHHPGADTRLLLDLAGRALLDPLAAFEVPLCLLYTSPSPRD